MGIDIEQARILLYRMLRRLCGSHEARLVLAYSGGRQCKASLRRRGLRIVAGSLDPGAAETCTESLLMDIVEGRARLLSNIVSLLVGLLGVSIASGLFVGVLGAAMLLVLAVSLLYRRRASNLLDEVNEAARIDGITQRLYSDIVEAVKAILVEAGRSCREKPRCRLALSERYHAYCSQLLSRYSFLGQEA